MTDTAPIPAPPADRIPTHRVVNCEYCRRYDRACGRHEPRCACVGRRSESDPHSVHCDQAEHGIRIDIREPADDAPVGCISASVGTKYGPEICYAVGKEHGEWYVQMNKILFDAAGIEEERIYVAGRRDDAEKLVRLFAALYEQAVDAPSVVDWNDDEDDQCEGHESLDGAHMGEAVYCDGSCRRVARP